VCVRARCVRLYSLSSALLCTFLSSAARADTRCIVVFANVLVVSVISIVEHHRASSPSASTSASASASSSTAPVSSRVLRRVFPAGQRACMDDTRARADEDIALDSSRLRSSARLGFASNAAAAAAAAAVTATAAAVTTTTTSTSASVAATTCRVARRKRKKRRRQRLTTSNDDVPSVAVAVASRSNSSATAACSNAVIEGTAADAVVVLEPDADAAAAATAGTDSAAARVDKPRSRLLVEQHTASGQAQPRVGGSGARAAASSVGTAGTVTLLNRRAGKRSPRRCNAAGGRRNAMTMDLQRLINEVHARPAIWDQKNVNYHNRDVILKMWREIARACEVSSKYIRTYPHHRILLTLFVPACNVYACYAHVQV